MREIDQELDRRDFMKEGVRVTAAAAATVLSTSAVQGAPADDKTHIKTPRALRTSDRFATRLEIDDGNDFKNCHHQIVGGCGIDLTPRLQSENDIQ